MENEVKIKESEDAQNSILDKVKSNKNLIIICAVILVSIIPFLIFRGKSSSENGGRKLNHYDYLIVDHFFMGHF